MKLQTILYSAVIASSVAVVVADTTTNSNFEPEIEEIPSDLAKLRLKPFKWEPLVAPNISVPSSPSRQLRGGDGNNNEIPSELVPSLSEELFQWHKINFQIQESKKRNFNRFEELRRILIEKLGVESIPDVLLNKNTKKSMYSKHQKITAEAWEKNFMIGVEFQFLQDEWNNVVRESLETLTPELYNHVCTEALLELRKLEERCDAVLDTATKEVSNIAPLSPQMFQWHKINDAILTSKVQNFGRFAHVMRLRGNNDDKDFTTMRQQIGNEFLMLEKEWNTIVHDALSQDGITLPYYYNLCAKTLSQLRNLEAKCDKVLLSQLSKLTVPPRSIITLNC